jgi:hypothetical protein
MWAFADYPTIAPLIEFSLQVIGFLPMHSALHATPGLSQRMPSAVCPAGFGGNVPAKIESTVSWTACIFRVCSM